MEKRLNENSLDTLCAALCYAMGIEPPAHAAPANPELKAYIDEKFGDQKADRVVMYNPDAIGQWIYEKYTHLLPEMDFRTELKLPLRSVMPSVTPVCFGTMYTGAQPEVHGIQAYEKPVITIDTIFDALIRAGKKPVLVAYHVCSLGKIFLERKMDYFLYDRLNEINAKAAELLMEDKYDFYVIYNGNYDSVMHKKGPESMEALAELRSNGYAYGMFDSLINSHWQHHRTLMGFAMDHGCHEIDGNCGSHGLDMPQDLNIMHFYKAKIGENAK